MRRDEIIAAPIHPRSKFALGAHRACVWSCGSGVEVVTIRRGRSRRDSSPMRSRRSRPMSAWPPRSMRRSIGASWSGCGAVVRHGSNCRRARWWKLIVALDAERPRATPCGHCADGQYTWVCRLLPGHDAVEVGGAAVDRRVRGGHDDHSRPCWRGRWWRCWWCWGPRLNTAKGGSPQRSQALMRARDGVTSAGAGVAPRLPVRAG